MFLLLYLYECINKEQCTYSTVHTKTVILIFLNSQYKSNWCLSEVFWKRKQHYFHPFWGSENTKIWFLDDVYVSVWQIARCPLYAVFCKRDRSSTTNGFRNQTMQKFLACQGMERH